MSVGDLWHGMVSCKSHVGELKNWIPKHSKKPSVRVELRAGGDPHRSEKPGWSTGDMRQWQKKRFIGIQFPAKGVLQDFLTRSSFFFYKVVPDRFFKNLFLSFYKVVPDRFLRNFFFYKVLLY